MSVYKKICLLGLITCGLSASYTLSATLIATKLAAATYTAINSITALKTFQTKQNPLIKKIAVLGKDNRTSLPEKYVDLASGIGILGQHGRYGWSCTAFCVAPNIIATNAHCIIKNPTVGRRLDLSRTLFVLPKFKKAKHKNKSTKLKSARHKYKSRITYPEFVDPKKPALSIYSGNFTNVRSVNSQSQDWAFVKLIHPVCKGRILSFTQKTIKELRAAARKRKIFMIGFHGDKNMDERLFSKECNVRSPNDRKFFLTAQRRQILSRATLLPHTCDAYKGSSGSPVLISTDKGPKVIGINLGSLRYERYQIRKNRYTGKIISRRKLKHGRETNMAVQPRAFLSGLARFEREELLHNLKALRQLQTHLKTFGYYKGRIDGVFGSGTRRAVIAYEKEKDLPILGLPTNELLKMLQKENKERPNL